MNEEININSNFTKYLNFNALSESDKLSVSNSIIGNAGMPNSRFSFGLASIDTSGNITSGNNQRNAAHPSGICAKTVVIFSAFVKNHNIVVTALTVIASIEHEMIAPPPCGSRRQTILEIKTRQNSPIRVIIANNKGVFLIANSVEDLLPLSFTNDYLED